ncbi:MAG TPA: hypothetical protein DCM86_16980 [Verrucomicrobiales bacterium]|nr:hypothetical protein [Verrucomicrobiales bacterium]
MSPVLHPILCRVFGVLVLASSLPGADVATPTPTPAPAPAPVPAAPAVVPATKPAPPVFAPRGDVEIRGDGGFEYDGETGRVVYKRNVKVLDPANDPRTIIGCEWLTTVLPPPGGRIGEIVALTNVVIQVKDEKGIQVATGNKAVFNPTNDTLIIYGAPPVVEMHTGTLTGDEMVIYNRQSNRFEAPGKFRIVARQGAPVPMFQLFGTNGVSRVPAPGTNAPPTPRPNP